MDQGLEYLYLCKVVLFIVKNCFNPETHDFMGGEEFTEDTIDQVLKLCEMQM